MAWPEQRLIVALGVSDAPRDSKQQLGRFKLEVANGKWTLENIETDTSPLFFYLLEEFDRVQKKAI